VRFNAEKAKMVYEIAALNESKHQLQFYEHVEDKRAISNEEMVRRRDQVAIHEARVQEAQARLDVIEMELNRLTVKSPIDASILQISTHLGEYAQTGVLSNPLLIVGNTDMMHVRVEVDETNAQGISPKAKAVGFLRGYNAKKITLKFVRVEPLLTSKKSLSNQTNELEDTRVLIIIYSFHNENINAYNGQQMDVYIDHENKQAIPK
jgi:multidrug resistance efflux pump